MSLVTIYSKRDDQGRAALEECTLITGVGPISFRAGQAEVTPDQAALLVRTNPNIELRHSNGYLEADTIAAASGPALPIGLQDASPDELDWCGIAVAAVRSGPASFEQFVQDTIAFIWPPRADADDVKTSMPPDAIAPTSTTPATPTPETSSKDDGGDLEPAPGAPPAAEGDEDPADPRPEDQQVDPSIAAAQQMLREEGEHVPKALPQGFEPTTSEGEPRCYARLGDGKQCSNPAKVEGEHSTYACGMARHVEQVGKLP